MKITYQDTSDPCSATMAGLLTAAVGARESIFFSSAFSGISADDRFEKMVAAA
jgi:hypothetical protein